MTIIARNQLIEKQFEERGDTKTIESINPVLSENSRVLTASVQPRRLSDEENILERIMETRQA